MVIPTFVLAFETHMLFMKGYVTIIAVDYVTMNAVIISLQSTDVLHIHYFWGGLEASQFFLLNFIASKETNYAIVTEAADRSALVCSYAGGLRIDPMALATVLEVTT